MTARRARRDVLRAPRRRSSRYAHGRVAVLDPASGARRGRRTTSTSSSRRVGDAAARGPRHQGALPRRGRTRRHDLAEPADDTAIMAFLVDATSGRYDLADVAAAVPRRGARADRAVAVRRDVERRRRSLARRARWSRACASTLRAEIDALGARLRLRADRAAAGDGARAHGGARHPRRRRRCCARSPRSSPTRPRASTRRSKRSPATSSRSTRPSSSRRCSSTSSA